MRGNELYTIHAEKLLYFAKEDLLHNFLES